MIGEGDLAVIDLARRALDGEELPQFYDVKKETFQPLKRYRR
jgi:hypothetical protein